MRKFVCVWGIIPDFNSNSKYVTVVTCKGTTWAHVNCVKFRLFLFRFIRNWLFCLWLFQLIRGRYFNGRDLIKLLGWTLLVNQQILMWHRQCGNTMWRWWKESEFDRTKICKTAVNDFLQLLISYRQKGFTGMTCSKLFMENMRMRIS